MAVGGCTAGLEKKTTEEARDILATEDAVFLSTRSSAVNQLRSVAGLCNAAEFDATTTNLPLAERKINGDATDQAILRFAESLGSVYELKRCWNTKYNLAFNSKNKFMVRVLGLSRQEGLRTALSGSTAAIFEPGDMLVPELIQCFLLKWMLMLHRLLTIKGAPEILLDRCANYTGPSGVALTLDAEARAKAETIKNEWSAQGRRVLLLAHKAISKSAVKSSPSSSVFEHEMLNQAKTGLTLVGMVAIVDPPRAEVPEVVRTLRGAGIRIFMVSLSLSTTNTTL